MVCTKCGAELKDTDLFCLKCGEEVQIVPDYNPVEEIVIQNLAMAQQNEIISQNTKDANVAQTIDLSTIKTTKKTSNVHKKKGKRKKFFTFPKILAITFLVIILVITLWNKHKNSYAYQYHKAEECIAQEEYQDSLVYLNKARVVNEQSTEPLSLMAKAYIGLNEIDKAIDCLNEALKIDKDNAIVAKQLMEVYSDYNYTDELNSFVENLKETKLAQNLGAFYLNRPSFSIESGTFDKFISVELTGKDNWDIYYTVDGTKPTIQAIKYSGQIRLRGGTTKVRAIAVNQSGEYSVENIAEYSVNSTVPDNPVIKPVSGSYSTPVPIQISIPVNCKVYYTLDGTTPTEKSCLYTRPIDMQLGKHIISAIAIDSNGIVSNTIQCNYNLEIESVFSIEQAYTILVQKLGNELIDERGEFDLECNSVIEVGGFNLYSFDKVYGKDANGNQIYSTDKYVFDVLTAETYYAIVNEGGGYDLTPF